MASTSLYEAVANAAVPIAPLILRKARRLHILASSEPIERVASVATILRRMCRARHSHDRLSEILALQHADERLRRMLQTVGHVLAVFDAPLGHPRAHFVQELAESIAVIERDDEA